MLIGLSPLTHHHPYFFKYRKAERVTQQPSTQPARTTDDPVSDREREVLRLIAAGLTNQQIADHLVITVNTVKRHAYNLYGKLGVKRRTQAVARARELALLS